MSENLARKLNYILSLLPYMLLQTIAKNESYKVNLFSFGFNNVCRELCWNWSFQNTEGYSGSDLKLVCKESAMRVVRKIFHTLEEHEEGQVSYATQHEVLALSWQ